jgi:hypothetical protein
VKGFEFLFLMVLVLFVFKSWSENGEACIGYRKVQK